MGETARPGRHEPNDEDVPTKLCGSRALHAFRGAAAPQRRCQQAKSGAAIESNCQIVTFDALGVVKGIQPAGFRPRPPKWFYALAKWFYALDWGKRVSMSPATPPPGSTPATTACSPGRTGPASSCSTAPADPPSAGCSTCALARWCAPATLQAGCGRCASSRSQLPQFGPSSEAGLTAVTAVFWPAAVSQPTRGAHV